MNEERKQAILFAATLLCARRLMDGMDSDKPDFAKQFWVDRTIRGTAYILERIDMRWPGRALFGGFREMKPGISEVHHILG